MRFDLWNNHRLSEVAAADVFFYPNEGAYRGNLYSAEGRPIGDYTADNSAIIEKHFPGIFGND